VSEVYAKVHAIISREPVKDYVPFSWVSLTQVKKEYYRSSAHYYAADGLLGREVDQQEDEDDFFTNRALEILQFLHEEDPDESSSSSSEAAEAAKQRGALLTDIRVPKSLEERRYLGKAHLREALLLHEESLRLHRMCRELKGKESLRTALNKAHDRSLER